MTASKPAGLKNLLIACLAAIAVPWAIVQVSELTKSESRGSVMQFANTARDSC